MNDLIYPKWISVKDDMPEISEPILCIVYDLEVSSEPMTFILLRQHGAWNFEDGSHYFDVKSDHINMFVSHWMPLPPPPND